jgi:hypothetical protein
MLRLLLHQSRGAAGLNAGGLLNLAAAAIVVAAP